MRIYNIAGVKDVSIKEGRLEITTLTGVENLDKLISTLVESYGNTITS